MRTTNSKSTDKMMIMTTMLIEMKEQLSEVEVEWKEIPTPGNETTVVVVPVFKMKFKNGKQAINRGIEMNETKGFKEAQLAYDNMLPEEGETCPKCGSTDMTSTKYSFECFECGESDEVDMDLLAESRAEAKYESRNERW